MRNTKHPESKLYIYIYIYTLGRIVQTVLKTHQTDTGWQLITRIFPKYVSTLTENLTILILFHSTSSRILSRSLEYKRFSRLNLSKSISEKLRNETSMI